MPHELDGYELAYTHRRSWKANLWHRGELIAEVPVTWKSATTWDKVARTASQVVWFTDPDELARVNASAEPFIVAVAEQHPNQGDQRPVFWRFTCLYRVRSTGQLNDETSLHTTVLERLRG